MIVVTALVVLVLRRIHIPNLVSYIISGLLLATYFSTFEQLQFGDVGYDDNVALEIIKAIAKVGIALLLFLVGLELSLEKIKDVGKVAIIAGVGQVVFTAIGGFILSLLLQFSILDSLFLAVALTFSSTVVVVKLLDQKRELHSLYGRIAVGIFLVQDLIVIIVLTFLAGLDSGSTLQPLTLFINMARAFGSMLVLLAFALFASKYLLDKPFTWASQAADTLFIWSLGWCFLFVMIAEFFNLSLEIGAFLAGISLAQLPCSHNLRRRVHPLVNFFIAVFFISLGAQMELTGAKQHLLPAFILSIFVLIGNPIIFIWIIGRMGYHPKIAFLTSVTVAQISEFSFIFAAVGLNAGLIGKELLAIIALIGLITIAVSSYMILYNHWLYDKLKDFRLFSFFAGNGSKKEELVSSLKNHILVVGLNTMGKKLVEDLNELGEVVLAIDTDARKTKGIKSRILVGNIDYLTVLEDAHAGEAKLVISTLQIEDTNNLLAFRCKQLDVPVVIHAFDKSIVDDLMQLGVAYLINSKALNLKSISKKAELINMEQQWQQ
jgi:Kef-type K+ transport system membrane component KefB